MAAPIDTQMAQKPLDTVSNGAEGQNAALAPQQGQSGLPGFVLEYGQPTACSPCLSETLIPCSTTRLAI